MAKRRQRARKQTPAAPADQRTARARSDERKRLAHPGIWLATLSTVVGIATGMFTLRDQVFPREAGSAAAVSVSAYQQQVGRICDELNDIEHRRAVEAKQIRRKLERARTTADQRTALHDGQRRTILRSGHALAKFTAAESPKASLATRRQTEATWKRNLARLSEYALRLDHAGTRKQLLAAIDYLSRMRPALAKDGVKLMSGLNRLGQASCDLRAPVTTGTFPLPRTLTQRAAAQARASHTKDRTRPSTKKPGANASNARGTGGGTTGGTTAGGSGYGGTTGGGGGTTGGGGGTTGGGGGTTGGGGGTTGGGGGGTTGGGGGGGTTGGGGSAVGGGEG